MGLVHRHGHGWNWDVLIFKPAVTIEFMKLFGQIGLWEMKGAKPTGWGLYTFWILEALIVLWMCYSDGSSMETPFCEFCNCWTEKKGAISWRRPKSVRWPSRWKRKITM